MEVPEHVDILHSEYFLLSKKQHSEVQKLEFVIPIPKSDLTSDELPPQIHIRAVSERWIGSETVIPVSFKHLILPSQSDTPFTDLLDVQVRFSIDVLTTLAASDNSPSRPNLGIYLQWKI